MARLGLLLRLATACLVFFAAHAAIAADLIGQVSVIDGDTLEIHGTRIRLWGIDAPESSQFCRGDDSLPYRCGTKAANELAALIERQPALCKPVTFDRYGRTIAICAVGGTDLADWPERRGLAMDWPLYSNGRYAAAQNEARNGQHGIWAGSFVEPWRYRDCVRLGGRSAQCSDEAR